jgi:hypothetical protein
MGGRQGRANGIRSGPSGVPAAPAAFVAETMHDLKKYYNLEARHLTGVGNVAGIINRANANGFDAYSTAAILNAAGVGRTQAAEAVLSAFPKQLGGLNHTTDVSSSSDGVLSTKTTFKGPRGGATGGTMERSFYADRVGHDYFQLQGSAKGKGAGYKIFKHQVDAYTKAGYKKLETTAAGGAGFNGAYTWGRFGYRFKSPEVGRGFVHSFNNYMDNLGVSAAQRAKIVGKLSKGEARPGDIGRVVATVRGKAAHVGKEFMQVRGWKGVFDLTKGSADRRYMNAYPKASKAIRAQVAAGS